MKYAAWEESQNEFERARSVYERCLDVDYRNTTVWLKYAEMEMKHKMINHARNVRTQPTHQPTHLPTSLLPTNLSPLPIHPPTHPPTHPPIQRSGIERLLCILVWISSGISTPTWRRCWAISPQVGFHPPTHPPRQQLYSTLLPMTNGSSIKPPPSPPTTHPPTHPPNPTQPVRSSSGGWSGSRMTMGGPPSSSLNAGSRKPR